MAAKLTYDTTNKLFILNTGVTSLDVKVDLYSDAKEDWLSDSSLTKFKFPIESVGGQSIGGGKSISPYYILKYGWKIRPQEADHQLSITGNVITDDDTEPFVNTVGNFNVRTKFVVSSDSITVGLDDIKSDLSVVKQIENGRWKIDDTTKEMVFYDTVGNPLVTFDLKDKDGNPTSTNVFERVPK